MSIKSKTPKKKPTTKTDIKSKLGVPLVGEQTGTDILMPHLNYKFRVIFDDSNEQYCVLTQNVKKVNVDFINQKLVVEVRDSAQHDIASQLANFSNMSGNMEVQYLNGVTVRPDKGIIFYGKTTALTTSWDYSNSHPTTLVLEFTFHDFNEYISNEN